VPHLASLRQVVVRTTQEKENAVKLYSLKYYQPVHDLVVFAVASSEKEAREVTAEERQEGNWLDEDVTVVEELYLDDLTAGILGVDTGR
jgi:predicted nucleic acid-binding protein